MMLSPKQKKKQKIVEMEKDSLMINHDLNGEVKSFTNVLPNEKEDLHDIPAVRSGTVLKVQNTSCSGSEAEQGVKT